MIPPCLTLSIIRYVSSGAIQWKEWRLPLLIGVVAAEKGAFWSPSTTIANLYIYIYIYTSGVIVIVIGNRYGYLSSNLERNCISPCTNTQGKVWIQLFSLQLWVNGQTVFFNLGMITDLGEGNSNQYNSA